MINARLFSLVSSMPKTAPLDTDAQAFITAASITDNTQKTAINQLVLDLKANSLWTKMKALYPFVGGNSTSHSKNLINPSQYQLTFYGGWTHSSTGVLPNGTNGFAKTGFSPDSIFTNKDSAGSTYYSRTNRSLDYGISHGCYDLNFNIWVSNARYSGNNMTIRLNQNGFSNTTASGVSDSRGCFTMNRNNSTQQSIYRNGSLLITGSVNSSNVGTGKCTAEMVLGANNPGVAIGSPNTNMEYYDNEEYAIFAFHDGLTSGEISTLNTINTTYQTTLSRNV